MTKLNTIGKRLYEKRIYLCFALAVLFGISLSLTQNAGYDEVYSLEMAKLKLGDIVRITSKDMHPPLYYLLLKAVMVLPVIPKAVIGKWLSLGFLVGEMLLILFPVRQRWGEKTASFMMFLMAVFPGVLTQGNNIRMYSAALFFASATGLMLVVFLEKQISVLRTLMLIGISLCAMYLHAFTVLTVFFMYAIALLVLVCRKEWKKAIVFCGSGMVVAVGFLPWLFVILRQANTGNRAPARAFSKGIFLEMMEEWFSCGMKPNRICILLGAFCFLVLGIACLFRSIREKKAEYLLYAMPFLLLVAVGVVYTVCVTPASTGRYYYSALGGLFLAAAWGYGILPRGVRIPLVVLLLIVFVNSYSSEIYFEKQDGLKQWKTLEREQIQNGDLIMLVTVHGITLQPEHDMMIYGEMPEYMPCPDIKSLESSEQLESYRGHNMWWIQYTVYDNEWYANGDYTEVNRFSYQNIDFCIFKTTIDDWLEKNKF